MLRLSIVLALILSLWSLASVQAESTIHTVITTECGAYFTWQSMGKQELREVNLSCESKVLHMGIMIELWPCKALVQ